MEERSEYYVLFRWRDVDVYVARALGERTDACFLTAIDLLSSFAVQSWLRCHDYPFDEDTLLEMMAEEFETLELDIAVRNSARGSMSAPSDWMFECSLEPLVRNSSDDEPELIGFLSRADFKRQATDEQEHFDLAFEVEEAPLDARHHIVLRVRHAEPEELAC